MAVSTVEEYLETLHENGKKAVNDFACFMQEAHPAWKCKISFSMPMWMKGKKMNEGYLAISCAKNHFSIHFSLEAYVEMIAASLPACKTGKRCINVKYDDEESYEIVKEYVKRFMEGE